MLGHVFDIGFAKLLPGWHQAITATYQGGHNLLRLAAVEPVVIGQVGEAITALSVGTMAHCTVIEKNTLGYLHGLGIVSQLRNRDLLVLGEDRREALNTRKSRFHCRSEEHTSELQSRGQLVC